MTCTTCGRENPPHLTFCQECGQRLGPRIAPPTPPIGLGVDAGMPEAAPAPHHRGAGAPGADFYAQPPSRLATSLGSGPSPLSANAQAQAQAQQQQHAQHAQHAQQGTAGGERRCRICATPNGPSLRYCTSCGSTLDPQQAPQGQAAPQPAVQAQSPRLVEAAPTAPAPLQASPIAPAPAPFAATSLASSTFSNPAPIAPMRVVDLGGGSRPPADAPKMCARCRGVVDSAAQFCKFCGASLAEAAPPPAPRVEPPAPAPAPAPVAAPQPAQSPYGPPPAPSPGIGPAGGVAPAAAHDPRANGGQPNAPRPVDIRPPTVPMNAAASSAHDPPTPFASFPAMGVAATIAPASQQPPAAAPTPAFAPPFPPPFAPPFPPAFPPAQAQAPSRPPAAPAQAPAPAYGPPPAPAQAPAPAPAQAPAPAPARAVTRGRLVVIAKSGADGPSYPIGDTLDVGRSEGQIIVAEDPYLSPRHVRIAWTGTKLVLRDLASTNGVFIRLVAARDMSAGKPVQKAAANDDRVPGEVAVPLHDQDLILVGQQVLRFESVTSGSQGDAGFGPAMEHGTLLFGSPAAPRYARLSQRTVEGVTRDVYYVRKVETVLGRESGDVVFTEDPFLSRRHAAIRVLGRDGAPLRHEKGAKPSVEEAVQFALVDLGSSNGSFLRIRSELDLVAGDHFRVGQQLFRVDFEDPSHGPRGRAG